MPPNTLRVHTEYVFDKSLGPKVLWAESRVQGTGEYFPLIQSHGKIVEVEIGGVAIYHPFGEFRRTNSYCHLYTRAFGDGPRHFDPWSNEEDDTRDCIPSPDFHTTPMGECLSLGILNVHRPLCTVDLKRCKELTHDTPATGGSLP
ncbi:uncharacterized protein TNCV_415661 [Trichonephila clavipes]|nr:uncharacterized protein TNCV_415661 [Trichonephila clavipes]